MKKPKRENRNSTGFDMKAEFERIRRECFGDETDDAADFFLTAPAPPAPLDEIGRTYWVKVAGLLVRRKVLKAIHLEPLEALCDAWARYQRLKTWLGSDPSRWVAENKRSGHRKPAAEVALLRESLAELRAGWQRFGLTPHAEPRLLPERGPNSRGMNRDAAGDYLERIAALKTIGDEESRPFDK
jgi:P27 family predicted phage terminase small subunit